MYDYGDRSVGISPTELEIKTNILFDKNLETVKSFYNLSRDFFDLGGTIAICIGEDKDHMDCWKGKYDINEEGPRFWKEDY